MQQTASCPDRIALQQLLLGTMSDGESTVLEEHVLSCSSCAPALRGLMNDDALFSAVRAQASVKPEPERVAAEALIGRLLSWGLAAKAGHDQVTFGGAPTVEPAPEATQEVYDFLAPPAAPDEIGRLGNYRVRRVLGVGGMGVVFEAEDPELGRPVALKVPRPGLASSKLARQRFRAEAQAAARLEHPHVIAILHVGEDRGVPYLAMPLLRGETLEARLKRDSKLPADEALRIGREIADGLAAAHQRGLIHRDVKPSNIWLEAGTGRAILLDFGLARIAGDAQRTHSGMIIGTPAYMAPEQARGEELDHRCDLFSLGCVLWHAVVGEAPFRGATSLAILRALEMEQPSPPRDVPPALADLLRRLIAKPRNERPATAAAVRETLDAIRAGKAIACRRRSWRRTVLAAAIVGVLIGGIVLLARSVSRSDRASEPKTPKLASRFAVLTNYQVGKRPYTVAIADFNGDRALDLAVSNSADNSVSVLLGAGDGSFGKESRYRAGGEPLGIVACDLNDDGLADLAVANAKDGNVQVLLGNGDGTFRAGSAFPAGPGARGLVAADLDNDGRIDLAVTESGTTTACVLFGNGDGTFELAVHYAVHGAPVSIAASDFNCDGIADLVVSNGGGNLLSVLLGAGKRALRPEAHYRVGSGPGAVVVADFNRDGFADLAVENVGSNDISVLLGRGDGTFGTTMSVPAGRGPGGLIAADFNNDNLVDLICANHHGNNLCVLFGKGDGTFRAPSWLGVGHMPAGVQCADFNGDGLLDVVFANHLSHDVSVLLGRPARPCFEFSTPSSVKADELVPLTIASVTAAGEADSSYQGALSLSSSDPRAELPAPRQRADVSVSYFTIRLRTAGMQLLRVTGDNDPDREAFATILVLPEQTARLRITAPEKVDANVEIPVTVTATDAFDNATPEVFGSIRLTCTDAQATLPPELAFAEEYEGVIATRATFRTPGRHTLTVTHSGGRRNIQSAQLVIEVNPRSK